MKVVNDGMKERREDFHFYGNDCEIYFEVHLRAFRIIPHFYATFSGFVCRM